MVHVSSTLLGRTSPKAVQLWQATLSVHALDAKPAPQKTCETLDLSIPIHFADLLFTVVLRNNDWVKKLFAKLLTCLDSDNSIQVEPSHIHWGAPVHRPKTVSGDGEV